MASGNYYGELFYGVAKSHLRQISGLVLKEGKYDKIIYFCCGSFNIAKAAIHYGYKPNQIYCSDISVYSSLLGYLFSNKPISTMPNLLLSEDIQKEVNGTSDEFTKVAIIMWNMRAINLSKISYRKSELNAFVQEKETYVQQYIDKLKKEYEILGGINYEIQDINDVLMDYGKNVCLVGFPPINTNDYEKIFDYKGAVELEVDTKMFTPDMFPEMFNSSLTWESSFLAFTTHYFNEIDKKFIFAAKHNGNDQYDYLMFNHYDKLPDYLKNMLMANKPKTYTPLKNVNIFGAKDVIRPDSKITIIPIKSENALFYRGLWIHNLGTTSASSNYAMLIDGKIFGVVGIADTSDLSKMKSDYVFLQYTASVNSEIYTNSIRLLEWCITSSDFKKLLYKTLSQINRFYRINGMKTVSLTKHDYVKASKGIFQIIKKEHDKKTGLNKITEYTKYRKDSYNDCLKKYLSETKYREGYRE